MPVADPTSTMTDTGLRGHTRRRFRKSVRRLVTGGALVAVVTDVAAAPALALPHDPCVKPGSAVSVARVS
jgi:hypothetical protein